MINRTILLRMKLRTWRELRHYFPGKRGESAADYFERLVNDILIEDPDLELEPIADRGIKGRFRK